MQAQLSCRRKRRPKKQKQSNDVRIVRSELAWIVKRLVMVQGSFYKSCSAVGSAHFVDLADMRQANVRQDNCADCSPYKQRTVRGPVTSCRAHWVGKTSRNAPATKVRKRGVAAQCGVQNDMQRKVECMCVQKRKKLHEQHAVFSVSGDVRDSPLSVICGRER
ncbi:hypothetical protein CC86DRAFT_36205 [Ophiobolus disseminans]|uniref:Uncharacterized protein n=1 Tax=Ophiobolus disseminans TaxID=1469910 RepID=A0A6A6ZZD3_9PLEO|nr:hypothetical protein CC86DRAFT_36205 [Ophiobolus disseminans]